MEYDQRVQASSLSFLIFPEPSIPSTHLQAGQVQRVHPRQRWVQVGRKWEEKGMAVSGGRVGIELFLACEKASPVIPLIPLLIPVLSLPNVGNGQMLTFR